LGRSLVQAHGCYGHTHERRDFTIGRTRIISNAKGYGHGDNPQFDENYVIEI
jgi:hypothetical protein